MRTFIKSIQINCNIDELFGFHLDSKNITRITPCDTKVELINSKTANHEGQIVKLKTTKFFIKTYWEVKIEKLKKPNILIDVAIVSPFKYWKHEHRFIQKDGLCELQDVIQFELPFGIFGRLFEPFILNDINKMFE